MNNLEILERQEQLLNEIDNLTAGNQPIKITREEELENKLKEAIAERDYLRVVLSSILTESNKIMKLD